MIITSMKYDIGVTILDIRLDSDLAIMIPRLAAHSQAPIMNDPCSKILNRDLAPIMPVEPRFNASPLTSC